MASLVEPETPRKDAGRRRLGWLARLRALIPAPLALLLVVVAIAGVGWALITPPFQSPDEGSHFAYAQSLAQRLALPGDHNRASYSQDQLTADFAVQASIRSHFSGEMRTNWSTRDYATYLAAAKRDPSRSDGGGPNAASANPPLYYLYADVAYWASYWGNTFDRLYAMRLWGVSLLLLTVVGAWLLAGEVLGRIRLAQLACATVVGLFPMQTFISTSVSPDAMLVTLWTFALWLATRVITRRLQARDALALCAVTAAAILTKATSYALVPGVVVALFFGWLGRRSGEHPIPKRTVAAAILVPALLVLAWIGLSKALGRPVINGILTPAGASARPFLVREFISDVWQYYLPRLPSMVPLRSTYGLPLFDVWLREGWGMFGFLEIEMSNWLYGLLTAITAAVAVVTIGIVARFRDRIRLELVGVYALVLVGLVGGLHLTEYRSILAGQGPVLQGRYLLPVIGLFGLAVALIVTRVPTRVRGAACGALAAGMLLLQILALATIVQGYYT